MKILYFAWVREKVGIGSEEVNLPDDVQNISDVINWLVTRGPKFSEAFKDRKVIRAAINQSHVKHDALIEGAQEIAFFPPVTGG